MPVKRPSRNQSFLTGVFVDKRTLLTGNALKRGGFPSSIVGKSPRR
jgi:hypothetical protein